MSLLTYGTAVCIIWGGSHLSAKEQMIKKRMEFFQCGKYGNVTDLVMVFPSITRYSVSVGCGNNGEITFDLPERFLKRIKTTCENGD
jgi:hypothetical protein